MRAIEIYESSDDIEIVRYEDLLSAREAREADDLMNHDEEILVMMGMERAEVMG